MINYKIFDLTLQDDFPGRGLREATLVDLEREITQERCPRSLLRHGKVLTVLEGSVKVIPRVNKDHRKICSNEHR